MTGPTAVFDPGWWYTAPPGAPAPRNTAQQVGDESRFIDAWPEEWAPVAAGLGARLMRAASGAYLLRVGLTSPARQLQKALTGEYAALGYESADFTIRAVFQMAVFDTRPAYPPTGDILIGGGPSEKFRVYTTGVVHGIATGVARRIVER